jgi:hypothetical protein
MDPKICEICLVPSELKIKRKTPSLATVRRKTAANDQIRKWNNAGTGGG